MNLETNENSYIFVIQYDDGEVVADVKRNIEATITQYENNDTELDFTTIGRIRDVGDGLNIDFNPELIEFYTPEDIDHDLKNDASMAILKYILNKR